MPQMAPISWLSLFIAFSLILLIFNCVNYYSFLPQPPKMLSQSINQVPMNWKW